MKVFLWQVMVDALPTNHFRFSRHISNDPNCSRCPLSEHETILHVLRDCPISLDFWNRLIDLVQFPQFYTSSLRAWMTWNLQKSASSPGDLWDMIFAVAIHYLWRMRNQEIFELITPSSDELFS